MPPNSYHFGWHEISRFPWKQIRFPGFGGRAYPLCPFTAALTDFFPSTGSNVLQRAPKAGEAELRFLVGFVGAGWSPSRPESPS